MLPPPPTVVDRDDDVRRIMDLVQGALAREQPCRVLLVGPAGVGTSTLAIHIGHRLAVRYPDGQLYADLGGLSGGVEPRQVLESFLVQLGEPAERIPASIGDRKAGYCTRTYGRRILVVLDNVVGPEQVRDLLPSSPYALVLITSSRRLPLLVSAGIHEVSVGHFGAVHAMEMLRLGIGGGRVEAEPDAASTLVAACAGLPRALELVSAKIRLRPRRSLAELARPLRAPASLEVFRVAGLPGLDVALEFCFSGLTAAQQEALLLLALHTGPDISVRLAAAMLQREPEEAHELLDELAGAHFLRPVGPQRYQFDAISRRFAEDRGESTVPPDRRTEVIGAAVRCQLGWAVSRAKAYSGRPCEGVEFRRHEAAYAGEGATARAATDLGAESANLTAAAEAAARFGLFAECVQLCQALSRWLYDTGRTEELNHLTTLAVEAADRTGDPRFIVRMQLELGMAAEKMGHADRAIAAFRRGGSLAAELGDDSYRASAIEWEGIVEGTRGNRDRALECLQAARAIVLASTQDARTLALLDLHAGRILSRTDRAQEALAALDRAEEYFTARDEILNRGMTQHVRGMALRSMGRLVEARRAVERAWETLEETPFAEYCLRVLDSLAEVNLALDDTHAAVAAWQRAYELAGALLRVPRQVEIAESIAAAYQQTRDIAAAARWRETGHTLAVAAGLVE